jgi:hypothetical protein
MGDLVFRGDTENAEAPFLSTEFWKKDTRIIGIVERVFKIDGRNNYAVKLAKPVEVEGEECDVVSIGESAGLRMAMQDAKLRELRVDDTVMLLCTGEKPATKAGNSPRKNFQIEIKRRRVEEEIPEHAL